MTQDLLLELRKFPRVELAHLPTPLESLPRLSSELGGPMIQIKRDDCTGLAMGGNKARKLEYVLGDARIRGAGTIVTVGALQSNHVRQTVAAAAKIGLRCHVILTDNVVGREAAYYRSGNLMLDELLGAQLHRPARDADEAAFVSQLLDDLREQGEEPYFIPVGASNPVGCLGYIHAAAELRDQISKMGTRLDAIVVATGSAGTQAGLLLGLGLLGMRIPVLGVSVGRKAQAQADRIAQLMEETIAQLGLSPNSIDRTEPVRVLDGYVGDGYGQPTTGMRNAVRLVARTEGILLDPVYSGKAMAGLIDQVRTGAFGGGQTILFWHTGGSPALFAYEQAFSQ